MKHRNIPVFIPHAGCPHDCVFCDQKRITGKTVPAPDARGIIEAALETVPPDADCEIAFFGGSFTGIPRADMIGYLDTASAYVAAGRASGIRLSTRPDYINDEILEILSRYPVRHVELGVQSTSDTVLCACERGHTADQAKRACRDTVRAGFALTGQMMIGLPSSTPQDELQTAYDICESGATGARIYPTVVLRGTKLEQMQKDGTYLPLTEEETVSRTASVLERMEARGLDILRVGLCATDLLCDSENAAAFDPAIGEKARSEIFYRTIRRYLLSLHQSTCGGILTVRCPAKKTSQVIGQKRNNVSRLCAEFGIKTLKTVESDTLFGYYVDCDFQGKENCK